VKTPIYSTSLHSSRMLHSASLCLDIGIKVIKVLHHVRLTNFSGNGAQLGKGIFASF
jgi:hypothetical protein